MIILFLLQPTSPLRKLSDIDNSIKLFLSGESATSLISVSEVSDNHPRQNVFSKK